MYRQATGPETGVAQIRCRHREAVGVASSQRSRRELGFWLFLLSNLLWIVWGIHARALALVILQVCLAGMNIRGERRNSST